MGLITKNPDARPRKKRAATWMARHKLQTGLIAALLVTTGVAAALLLRQDVATTTMAADPDVIFAQGTDYHQIATAGFASLQLGASATSASLTLYGVPGAASLQMTNLLRLSNTDSDTDYSITLSRSAAPPQAMTHFTWTLTDSAGSLVATWDAHNHTSTTFALPAGTTYDLHVALLVADGTPPGRLGALDLQFQLSPQ